MTESELRRKGLRLIEEYAAAEQAGTVSDHERYFMESQAAFAKIYRIAHTINAKACRKNHAKWMEDFK